VARHVLASGDAADGGPGHRGRQRRVAARVGALERDAVRRRSFSFCLPMFVRRLLKILKQNSKNFEYQSCRATIGEQFS
jgi:hypothetical protein